MAGFAIGLVGPFGSGCTFVSSLIEKCGYKYISLSNILRNIAKENGHDNPTRQELQDIGNEVRRNNISFLAQKAWETMQRDLNANYVIDSIRNPEEVDYLRKNHPKFFLFGIFADQDIRWDRVKDKYSKDRRTFDEDDSRDSGEKIRYGQRVTDTFRMADIVLLNNELIREGNDADARFKAKVKEKVDIIQGEIPFRPTNHETNMAMAYASSMRSSCLKRKVGAMIVDEDGNAFSSGYNEVPSMQKTCKCEYGGCYRDGLKKEFKQGLENIIHDPDELDQTFERFKTNFKILDYCRALHAEESAILNVAKIGVSIGLSKATLYTTTYPCNLCANKIAQVGIGTVVYYEPYPMPEAKAILAEKKVKQIPFEGVTYNGYFRFMEVTD